MHVHMCIFVNLFITDNTLLEYLTEFRKDITECSDDVLWVAGYGYKHNE